MASLQSAYNLENDYTVYGIVYKGNPCNSLKAVLIYIKITLIKLCLAARVSGGLKGLSSEI
jgi:hypothetical protein